MNIRNSNWLGRNLANYKSMHIKTAETRNVKQAFQTVKTLTQARKILFGYKKGHIK